MRVVTSFRVLRQLSRVLAIAAMAGVVAVVAVDCGDDDHKPSITGTVIKKEFVNPDPDEAWVCKVPPKEGEICTAWGRDTVTKPPHYRLLVKGGDREEWEEVTKEEYDRIRVGDPWPEPQKATPTPTTGGTAVTTPTTTATAPADPAPGTP